MPSQTTIRVTDASGNFLFETAQFLEIGDNPGLHYVLSCGLVGALTVTIPPEFNSMLLKDGRIHIMRSVNGGPAQREGGSCFLIRKWEFANDYTTITALHANSLFWTRHNLYPYAGYERDNQAGDDFIKDVWRLNAGTGITGTRAQRTTGASSATQADISAYIALQTDLTLAPVVALQFAWQNVGDIFRSICDAATLNGTYLTVEIVAPTESTLELQTFVNQRGVDRRFSTGSGLLFTEARGNLANALLTVDAMEEITFAFAGGANRDQGYSSQWAIDLVRTGESVFGRRETFVDCSDSDDLTYIQSNADAAVRGGRPVVSASAELQETDQCIRGIHFDYGDVVTVEVQQIQYNMRLDVLDIELKEGVETTKAAFFYDDR